MFAAALAMPPMVTITGCVPSGTFAGMRRLTCITPTSALGIPANSTTAATPPIETETFCTGAGNSEAQRSGRRSRAVETAGETAPAPVRYRLTTAPRAAVAAPAIAPFASVNTPGAAAAAVSVVVAVRPLLLTVTAEG